MRTAQLIALLGLPLAACGGGSVDPNDPPPTSTGQAVITSATRTAVVEDKGGGFIPAPPAGSTCLPGARKFTVTFATSTLDSAVCVGSSMTPYKTQTSTNTLTAAEMAEVRTVLDGLKVVARSMQCAADASILGVTVTTGGGTREYIDDLNQCTDESKPLLPRSAISAALNKLAALGTSDS
jgi:hypothetical protein